MALQEPYQSLESSRVRWTSFYAITMPGVKDGGFPKGIRPLYSISLLTR